MAFLFGCFDFHTFIAFVITTDARLAVRLYNILTFMLTHAYGFVFIYGNWLPAQIVSVSTHVRWFFRSIIKICWVKYVAVHSLLVLLPVTVSFKQKLWTHLHI
jgi:hypothetical protein